MNINLLLLYFITTVSFVLSSRRPSFHQVSFACGLDPEDWQTRSYRRPADSG